MAPVGEYLHLTVQAIPGRQVPAAPVLPTPLKTGATATVPTPRYRLALPSEGVFHRAGRGRGPQASQFVACRSPFLASVSHPTGGPAHIGRADPGGQCGPIPCEATRSEPLLWRNNSSLTG